MLRQPLDRSRRDGQRAFADGRLRTGLPAGTKRRAEHAFEKRPRARGIRERRPHLAEDLRFAEDERLETAADAEEMRRRGLSVQPRGDSLQFELSCANRVRERRGDGLVVTGHPRAPVDLGSVAGLDDDRFDAAAGQILVHAGDRVLIDGEMLQAVESRVVVVDRDDAQRREAAERRDRMKVHVRWKSGADVLMRARE